MRKGFLILVLAFATPFFAHAASIDELQGQINLHNQQIAALETEIAKYQAELDALGKQKSSLQSTITSLSTTQKQLAAQISVTLNQISSANLKLDQLSLSIDDAEGRIDAGHTAIAKSLRDIAEHEDQPLIARLFAIGSLADVWHEVELQSQFNRALAARVEELRNTKTVLASNRDAVATTKTSLVSYQNELSTQKRTVDATKGAQQSLLTQTKNQESNYQKLIAQKLASEKAFEQELINLQGQLNLIVNPGSLPKVGSGVLSWPFSLSFMQQCASRKAYFGNTFCITQYFGNTSFSTANPQIYNGHGHNAIDMAVPIGTPVDAALGGVVLGTGNTDLARGCYSFGKWIMLKHPNGINTLYSHLSTIDVSQGQSVSAGQVIGLSGMTGYATGPHLHFGVYASDGTRIMNLGDFRGTSGPCAHATMPVATIDAYLNPLSYL